MAETKVFLSKCLENLVAKSPRFNKRLPESARGVLGALVLMARSVFLTAFGYSFSIYRGAEQR